VPAISNAPPNDKDIFHFTLLRCQQNTGARR